MQIKLIHIVLTKLFPLLWLAWSHSHILNHSFLVRQDQSLYRKLLPEELWVQL